MTVTKVEPHESIPGAWYIEEKITREQYDEIIKTIESRTNIVHDPVIICSSPCGPNWIYEAWKRTQEDSK